MGPISSPETSVRNYHYALPNSPQFAESYPFVLHVARYGIRSYHFFKQEDTDFVEVCEKNVQLYSQLLEINVYICVY